MKIADIFRRAGKNLRQAKARTILTSLAIGVGAFTIALAMAAGSGGRAFTDDIINASGDIYSLNVYPIYEQDTPTNENKLAEYGVENEEQESQHWMTEKDIAWLKDQEGVESIRPMLFVDSQYMTRGEGYSKRVARLSVKTDRSDLKLVAGSLTNNMPRPGEVVVPEEYLKDFGFKSATEAIGKPLTIHVPQTDEQGSVMGDVGKDFTFTIAAVDKQGDTMVYYDESVRISSEDATMMYAYQFGEEAGGRYYGVTALARSGTDILSLRNTIRDKGYEVYSLEDMREQLLQMVSIAQWGLAGFGALAILASIFGIINTQYISVLERTQQIGLMKALGMRRRDIAKLFRYEAAWIGFIGGVIGVGLAWAVSLLNPVITNFLELEEGTRLLRIDWISSLLLIVGLMLIAVLSGYFPARKAAKLDPIEALRTE